MSTVIESTSVGKTSSGTTAAEARLDAIEAELAEICGQLNVLHARASELAAEVDDDAETLLGGSGCASVEEWLTWQTGWARGRARQTVSIARRRHELPELVARHDAGQVSADQLGAVAARIPAAADGHFAELAQVMSVAQLRTAVRAAVPPTPAPDPLDRDEDHRRFSFGHDDDGSWTARIKTTAAAGAHIETGLRAHLDALHNEHHRARAGADLDRGAGPDGPPLPTWFDALDRMVDRSLERDAVDRPHHRRTKVLVHVDAHDGVGRLHLGPALSVAERNLVSCDADIATVLRARGVPVSVGRSHRIVPEPLRTLIEDRDRGCVHPRCGATRKLVVHHIDHWVDGGGTDTDNLVALCPRHHREVHAGHLDIVGNPDVSGDVRVVDRHGRTITGARATGPPGRPPDPPPRPYRHPDGGRMRWDDYVPPGFANDN